MGEPSTFGKQEDIENDRAIALILSEELDGSFAKRLPDLAPVPHVPKVNSFIPKFSDASLDYQRLRQRLNVYGLHEVRVSGDGNCQFRALADQIFGSHDRHKIVRREVVAQLKDRKSLYESYVPMNFEKYCKRMKRKGEWGDHVTLQAAAEKICLLTSFRDTCFVEIVPQLQSPRREVWLSFWSEVHYNSLYQMPRVPMIHKVRKKHWLF